MRFPAKVLNSPLQLQEYVKLLNKLNALLTVKYGTENFKCFSKLTRSAAYKTTGRYNYSVLYVNRKTGDEICLRFPIKSWTPTFFECLEDKIIKTLDFCIAQTEEE